jgi:hypothetical protein
MLLTILFVNIRLVAQTPNSLGSLDAYIGLPNLTVGMNLKDVKGKLIPVQSKTKSDNSGRVYYNYVSREAFFSDENIHVKSVQVKAFQDTIEEVEITFSKFDDIKIFQKFREQYGMFTDKPNLYQDIYYWAGNTVKLMYNYSDNAGNPTAKFGVNL